MEGNMARKNSDISTLQNLPSKETSNQELRRNIVVGAILRKLHKEQGTMPYLIQMLEPYLKKADRKLFGLPF